jgi:hypothetical protein
MKPSRTRTLWQVRRKAHRGAAEPRMNRPLRSARVPRVRHPAVTSWARWLRHRRRSVKDIQGGLNVRPLA